GLLQTRDYARVLLEAWKDVPLDETRRRLDLRMERQQILLRLLPPHLNVVLDESCVRRAVGGPEVMAEQCRRLLSVAGKKHITLRILPFDAGPHQAMGFPFHIFDFTGDDPAIVYVELLNRSEVVESAEEVGRYRAAFTQARERALPPKESI